MFLGFYDFDLDHFLPCAYLITGGFFRKRTLTRAATFRIRLFLTLSDQEPLVLIGVARASPPCCYLKEQHEADGLSQLLLCGVVFCGDLIQLVAGERKSFVQLSRDPWVTERLLGQTAGRNTPLKQQTNQVPGLHGDTPLAFCLGGEFDLCEAAKFSLDLVVVESLEWVPAEK